MNKELILRNLGGKDSILVSMPDDYEMQGWAYDTSNWFTSGTHETYPTQIFQKCKDIQINGKKYTFKDDITLDDYFIISLTADGYQYQVNNSKLAVRGSDLIMITPYLWKGNKINSSGDVTGVVCMDKFLKDCGLDNLSYNNNSFLLTLIFQDGTDYFANRSVYANLSNYMSSGIEMRYDALTPAMNGQYKLWVNLVLE